jgi:hypothetical protein
VCFHFIHFGSFTVVSNDHPEHRTPSYPDAHGTPQWPGSDAWAAPRALRSFRAPRIASKFLILSLFF